MVTTTRRLPLCIAFAGLLVAGMAARAFGSYSATDTPPRSGTFTLHGRLVDTLSDRHTLMHFRAPYASRTAGFREDSRRNWQVLKLVNRAAHSKSSSSGAEKQ